MPTERQVEKLVDGYGEFLDAHRGGPELDRYSDHADRPTSFIEGRLGDTLTDYQKSIARDVLEKPLVTVRSCHAAGKDFLAIRLAIWWAVARQGLVVISGPTSAQVEEILMRGEGLDAFRGSGLPGEWYVNAYRPGGDGKAGIIAKTATGTGRLTGFHDSEVLFILTEAQDEHAEPAWDAAFAVTTGEGDRILTLGNPTRPDGRFYKAHKPSSSWHAVKIAASDIPNVQQGETVVPGLLTKEGAERFASEYGMDSGFYKSRVLAEFPEEADDALIPRESVEAAFRLHESGAFRRWNREEGLVVGFDPARYGPDKSVVCVRKGQRVREFKSWGKAGTMESVGRLIKVLNGLNDLDITVVIDEAGLGGGVLDRLKETRKENPAVRQVVGKLVGFNGGTRARKHTRFKNKRAEVYFYLKKRLEDGDLALPPDDELNRELGSIRWSVASDGRIKLESKDDLRGRLGHSPDRADALTLTLCDGARSSFEPALIPM